LGLTVQDGRATRTEFTGTVEAFRKIAGRDGVAGLYQGMRANLLGSTFSWGLYFFLYGSLKNFMSDNGQTKLAAHHHMLAAAEAGKNTHTHFLLLHARTCACALCKLCFELE